jgi:hypothetical protein
LTFRSTQLTCRHPFNVSYNPHSVTDLTQLREREERERERRERERERRERETEEKRERERERERERRRKESERKREERGGKLVPASIDDSCQQISLIHLISFLCHHVL